MKSQFIFFTKAQCFILIVSGQIKKKTFNSLFFHISVCMTKNDGVFEVYFAAM